jgi:hypothetical protein
MMKIEREMYSKFDYTEAQIAASMKRVTEFEGLVKWTMKNLENSMVEY